MAKSQQTFSKKEKEKKRLKKRQDKLAKQEERKASKGSGDMIAYVDEFGNFTDTPPDPAKKKKVNAKTIEVSIPKREKVEYDPIRTGRVDFFDHSKGFGFIIDLETQDKVFVHVNGLTEEIIEGNKVSFEVEQGLKGLNAVRVKKV